MNKNKKPNVVQRRPTETITGAGGAAVVYAWLTQAGFPNGWAAIIAVIVAFVPGMISNLVDQIREVQNSNDF